MSGRPQPGMSWTLSGNYPAGANPWNGNPIAGKPAGTYFTPNVKPAAQDFNWLFGTLAAQDSGDLNWAGNDPALDWCPQSPPTNAESGPSGCQFQNAYWSNNWGCWIVCIAANAGAAWATYTAMNLGQDQGASTSWNGFTATGISDPTGIIGMAACDDPGGGQAHWCTIITDTGANQLAVRKYTAGAWAQGRASQAVTTPVNVEMATIGSYVIYAVGSSTAGDGKISSSHDGGTTWNDYTMAAAGPVILKSNGSQVICFPGINTNATAYYTSPDGVTWTSQSVSAFMTGSDIVVGLAWGQDTSGSCWLLAIWNGTAAKVRFLRSADGVTWTQTGSPTTTGTSVQVQSLTSMGGLWLATVYDPTSNYLQTNLVLYSDDAVNWYKSQVGLGQNASAAAVGYTRPRVYAGPCQALLLNTNWLRFSALSGLPAAAL